MNAWEQAVYEVGVEVLVVRHFVHVLPLSVCHLLLHYFGGDFVHWHLDTSEFGVGGLDAAGQEGHPVVEIANTKGLETFDTYGRKSNLTIFVDTINM